MPFVISGGHAIQYWSALTVDFRKKSIAPGDPIEKEAGMKICATVKKNHCVPSRNPYVKVEYYVIYGKGIEQIMSSIDPAIAAGILESHGAWLSWIDHETGEIIEKFPSRGKFREYMDANPDAWERFSAQLSGNIKVHDLSEDEMDAVKADEKVLDEIATEQEDGTGKTE